MPIASPDSTRRIAAQHSHVDQQVGRAARDHGHRGGREEDREEDEEDVGSADGHVGLCGLMWIEAAELRVDGSSVG